MSCNHRFSSINALEARRLLAFTVFDPEYREMRVTGTAGDDVISVAFNEHSAMVEFTLNGVTENYARPGINVVAVDALDGDDKVSILWAIASSVEGGAGDDSIIGVNGPDRFNGGAGNDTLDGGANDDEFYGSAPGEIDEGDDIILGRAGNDTFYISGGDDLIIGGSGEDQAAFSDVTDPMTLSLDGVANDGIIGQNPQSNLVAIERVYGGDGDDLIVGNAGQNNLEGGDSGNDTLIGLGGDDNLGGTEGADSLLDGGSGDDSLSVLGGTARGQGGNDFISAFDVDAVGGGLIEGGSGNDNIDIIGTGFTVRGESGDDDLSWREQLSDEAAPNPTVDMSGGAGNDTLRLEGQVGTSYQITFDGQANDGVRGIAGTSNFRTDFEVIFGSSGDDILDVSARLNSTTIQGQPGDDSIVGGAGGDRITGGDGDDTIRGHGGKDSLYGFEGNDLITGGTGADKLFGSSGDDSLQGGLAHDTLLGYTGVDHLINSSGDTVLNPDPADVLEST